MLKSLLGTTSLSTAGTVLSAGTSVTNDLIQNVASWYFMVLQRFKDDPRLPFITAAPLLLGYAAALSVPIISGEMQSQGTLQPTLDYLNQTYNLAITPESLHPGDISFGKLDGNGLTPGDVDWKPMVGLLALIGLTLCGVAVSTTLFTLSMFGEPAAVASILGKSGLGLVVGLGASLLTYGLAVPAIGPHFNKAANAVTTVAAKAYLGMETAVNGWNNFDTKTLTPYVNEAIKDHTLFLAEAAATTGIMYNWVQHNFVNIVVFAAAGAMILPPVLHSLTGIDTIEPFMGVSADQWLGIASGAAAIMVAAATKGGPMHEKYMGTTKGLEHPAAALGFDMLFMSMLFAFNSPELMEAVSSGDISKIAMSTTFLFSGVALGYSIAWYGRNQGYWAELRDECIPAFIKHSQTSIDPIRYALKSAHEKGLYETIKAIQENPKNFKRALNDMTRNTAPLIQSAAKIPYKFFEGALPDIKNKTSKLAIGLVTAMGLAYGLPAIETASVHVLDNAPDLMQAFNHDVFHPVKTVLDTGGSAELSVSAKLIERSSADPAVSPP